MRNESGSIECVSRGLTEEEEEESGGGEVGRCRSTYEVQDPDRLSVEVLSNPQLELRRSLCAQRRLQHPTSGAVG